MLEILIQVVSVVAQLATSASLILLYRQINSSQKATESQLINELEKEFGTYYGVFAKLKPGGEWHDAVTLSNNEVAELENLAAFCEKLQHFHDRDVLDWSTLDLLFRNRFFLIMQNPNVVVLVVKPCQEDWAAALDLEKQWRLRLKSGDPRRTDIVHALLTKELPPKPAEQIDGPDEVRRLAS